jgi:hypothetical protein
MFYLRAATTSRWIVTTQLLLLTALLLHIQPYSDNPGRSPGARLTVCGLDSAYEGVFAPSLTTPLKKNIHAPASFLITPEFCPENISFSYASFSGGIPRSSSILLLTLSTSSDL